MRGQDVLGVLGLRTRNPKAGKALPFVASQFNLFVELAGAQSLQLSVLTYINKIETSILACHTIIFYQECFFM